jgi:hypothetical protein
MIAVLAGMVGCGDPASDPSLNHYHAGCLTRVFSEIKLDQDRLTWDVVAARKAMVQEKLMTDQQFCDAFAYQDIYILDVDELSPGVRGMHDTLGNVWLSKDIVALAHELLHVWDMEHGHMGTIWHEGWTTNGYDAAAGQYDSVLIDPSVTTE